MFEVAGPQKTPAPLGTSTRRAPTPLVTPVPVTGVRTVSGSVPPSGASIQPSKPTPWAAAAMPNVAAETTASARTLRQAVPRTTADLILLLLPRNDVFDR